MYSPEFNIGSLILYVTIAIICCCCLKMSIRGIYCGRSEILRTDLGYIYTCIILILFAICRKVSANIGGADALNYESIFLDALNSQSKYDSQEVLFGIFNRIIRSFTSNPILYRSICYSIIAFSYIIFIKCFSEKWMSVIPYLVIVLFYLKSFNTMRSSLAVAIFTIALVLLYKNKKIIAFSLIISTVFIHRMSVLYIPFIIFYFFGYKFIINMGLKRMIFFLILYSWITYIIATSIQTFVLGAMLLDGTDSYYLQKNMNGSIFDSSILLLPLIALLIFWFITNRKLNVDNRTEFLTVCIAYDIIIAPAAILLGMWRFNEFMFLERLTVWGVLISLYRIRFERKSRILVTLLFVCIFLGWLIYRIEREWDPCKIMPYIFIWD